MPLSLRTGWYGPQPTAPGCRRPEMAPCGIGSGKSRAVAPTQLKAKGGQWTVSNPELLCARLDWESPPSHHVSTFCQPAREALCWPEGPGKNSRTQTWRSPGRLVNPACRIAPRSGWNGDQAPHGTLPKTGRPSRMVHLLRSVPGTGGGLGNVDGSTKKCRPPEAGAPFGLRA